MHVDAFLPQATEKKRKRTNKRASEREISGGEFFSSKTGDMHTRCSRFIFYRSDKRRNCRSPRALRGLAVRAIETAETLIIPRVTSKHSKD